MTETPSTPAGPAPQVVGSAAARSAEHRRKSLSTRPKDMLLSMAVIVGIVLVLLLLVPRPNEVPTRSIDPASAAVGAQADLGFTPVVPELSEGWTPRAAGLQLKATDDVTAWQLTYTTPSGTYAGVQQAENPTEAWESRQVTDGKEDGTENVGGLEWVNRSRTDRGTTSWVHRGDNGITTIVTGTADETQMAQFATAVAAELD
ncbi:DUF4245 domain-containing protein [Kineosporia rhizophila]|uniref:DUF4245 domain-containing protein n=1 Tax=Kineosporia TaxID=49184 RepID=UPI000AD5FB09|nr:DUF4245 domain-containing protein [Kineosporia sp. NBRC 101677]MCE0535007.1 DUF4245 domain-containing protein [Kineosporia rhizophila]GLY14709.1 hypothetical protein Kisp01_17240 [Kineosporia sp. NBRC 101677]